MDYKTDRLPFWAGWPRPVDEPSPEAQQEHYQQIANKILENFRQEGE